jgi:hypothetical protein
MVVMKAHARSWACRCGAHLIVTFDIESGTQTEQCPQFACPRCRAIRRVESIPGERIKAESLKVRRS